jgi:hypothetical protein
VAKRPQGRVAGKIPPVTGRAAGRIGIPDDVANAALASDEANYITGTNLPGAGGC